MVTAIELESLRGLADPTRRRIVERLSRGGLAVGEIAAGFPMSRPAVSKHLRILRELGLVVERREGRNRIYELAAEPLEEIGAWLQAVTRGGGVRSVRTSARPGAAHGEIPPTPDRAEGVQEVDEDAAAETVDDDARWRSW